MVHIQMLGKNCPNLASLWLRSNYFQVAKGSRDELPEDMTANHLGFRNLRTLYFRVGEGELALTFVPTYVLSYILRNAVDLTELKIALRSYILFVVILGSTNHPLLVTPKITVCLKTFIYEKMCIDL